jgi:hypothetical protein
MLKKASVVCLREALGVEMSKARQMNEIFCAAVIEIVV